MKKLVECAFKKDPIGLKEAFAELISEKLESALTEKVAELSEISYRTLDNYRDKASLEIDKDWHDTRANRPGLSDKKLSNRVDGVEKAYQKMKAKDRIKNES